MKYLKIISVITFIVALFYLAFYKTNKINIEGNWDPEEIVLNNKKVFPKGIVDSLFKDFSREQISINEWTDSIYLHQEKISAKYSIREENNKKLITLSSNEKALNGDFELKVDTIYFDDKSYQIKVEILSESTYLKFYKNLHILPWKPQIPRKGLP